ncbi:type II toxin-antitoxin system VapC family toxin [Puniceicoccales bacterium CK1056]|uniref:Type II toxin-antitoxin system VapC family toxin n=1 Tax=Oceanipulchritudo coccoides TaxID=2706888 RepID=A0A6B2M5Z4_9BACT|nr:type II toxin-antitoxin system VapC family toxin [Oceanipulchritudo coccoides]NDV63579.1 type II toxin-antitoxin system VapC family toxin [Oceanipulchritudo coccoides]
MSRSFVLDCSATLPWIFADEARKDCDGLLRELGKGAAAWVPALWHLELGNVLLGAMKHKRIDQAGIEIFLSNLGELDIRIDPETMKHAWVKTIDLGIQYKLTTYDAAYLELALRQGFPLATLDKGLVRAARTSGVELCLGRA